MTLYHATAANNVPSILREGLIPAKAKGADAWADANDFYDFKYREPSVYLTPDLTDAKAFAQFPATVNASDAAILRVRIPPNDLHRLKHDEEMQIAFRYPDTIPPEWIKVQVPRVTLEQSKRINNRYQLVRNA